MEKFPTPNTNEERFEVEKSPISEAYYHLGAHTPLELSEAYSKEDQKFMLTASWDYENKESIVNKVKDILETADVGKMAENEKTWRNEILWFWYHHAVSCAIWRYKDREAAKKYTAVALSFQNEGHPNQITKLFQLLLDDRVLDAEAYVEGIPEEHPADQVILDADGNQLKSQKNVEKETAKSLLKEYKENQFGLPPIES